ncbi:hypothetical protein ACTWPB_18760 [Nocardia sp. IBHARD005]|uniref:hypothetical protein n=1 Tax=Nocardia sp. IBHARD005 TaxID=3457765 RepID=UPI004059B902
MAVLIFDMVVGTAAGVIAGIVAAVLCWACGWSSRCFIGASAPGAKPSRPRAKSA